MSVRLFGCKKFGRLLNEREDRLLKDSEIGFLAKHRSVCPACKKEEAASVLSLNMLRAAAMEEAPAEHFDERLLRRIRVSRVKESLGYWTPALLGGGIACVALFVTLHLLSQPTRAGSVTLPAGEALRSSHAFPSFELHQIPKIDR